MTPWGIRTAETKAAFRMGLRAATQTSGGTSTYVNGRIDPLGPNPFSALPDKP